MSNETKEEKEATPSLPTPAPQMSSVADLERRLQILDTTDAPTAPAPAPIAVAPVVEKKPAAVPAKPASGKSALLARIQAAKEKSLQAQAKPPPTPAAPVDILSGFDAPAKASDPPPAYDTNFLPPPPPPQATAANPNLLDMLPPPAYDASAITSQAPMSFPAPPPINAMAPPPPLENVLPPPPAFPSAPVASAPMFEDLMGGHTAAMPPPPSNLMDMQAVPPPPMEAPAVMAPPGIDEDILAALDPAERDAILEEQRKIMEQIEKEKSNDKASSAAARAMAFDQRSSAAVARVAGEYDSSSRPAARPQKAAASAANRSYASSSGGGRTVDLGAGEVVPLHGQERTQKAIEEGNALIVQCMNCQNWMQVTKDATLMFCPQCNTVSPVVMESAATAGDMEAAAQLSADQQLAEKLQAEEYARAGGNKKTKKKEAKLEKGQAVQQSWMDWMLGAPAEAPPPKQGSAEIRPRGLVAASTGEEGYGGGGGGGSYGGQGSGGGGSGGARVAQSKGMFACVADAVGTAATTMYAINQDDEGNVHGVDASGLLAMPNVSRQQG